MIKTLDYSEIEFQYKVEDLPKDAIYTGIVGQEKALSALRIGLLIDKIGYNIFISGDVGTGRLRSVKQEIGKIINNTDNLKDIVYTLNPNDKDSPLCLSFKKGMGKEFCLDLSKIDETNKIDGLTELIKKYEDKEIKAFLTQLLSLDYEKTNFEALLAIDHSNSLERPLIIESHPSFENLFGYYDDKSKANHLGLNLGSFQKAAGGFLVLTAEELLAEKGLWDALKRNLDSVNMAIESKNVKGSLGKGDRVRPQPIPVITKVILLGSDDIYDALCDKDEQFLRLFKIAPQFDYMMAASKENIKGTIGYIKKVEKDTLLITDSAICEILRYSAYFCEDRSALTTQLSHLGDLILEADILARIDGKEELTNVEIEKAIRNREYISSISEERINEEIRQGELIISLSGKKAGIVNGLAVMDRGHASFGTPAVISATVAPGTEGIVNIEHEAGLSGEIHDKGILILEGYLRKMYARNFPLSIYAGLCFEQNYSEVDGDSASSSELYALLSAIGDIPVRQDIAITGSVNQMGILQPVGGINEKIYGFYKACKSIELTGTQGVIIPKQNIKSLILPREVEQAIKEGKFHIWALETIEEGMSLLTDMPASQRNNKDFFSQKSFNHVIETSLRRLYEAGQGPKN